MVLSFRDGALAVQQTAQRARRRSTM